MFDFCLDYLLGDSNVLLAGPLRRNGSGIAGRNHLSPLYVSLSVFAIVFVLRFRVAYLFSGDNVIEFHLNGRSPLMSISLILARLLCTPNTHCSRKRIQAVEPLCT